MCLQRMLSTKRVFMSIRELPDECRPAMVSRYSDSTLLVLDPRETRLDVLLWAGDHLLEDELLAIRVGFGFGCQRMPDWASEPLPALLYVPKALRLPGQSALQGGAELQRRRDAGELGFERQLEEADTGGDPTAFGSCAFAFALLLQPHEAA